MSYFGLDIGSYALKFVKADGHGSHAKVKSMGSLYNSVGQILPTDPHQFEQLALLIKNGVKEFGLTGLNCHLSLPSHQAYMSIISMPILSDAELSSAIKWEAEQHIPVSLSDVNFEYDVIYRPPKGEGADTMSVFMVGAPKETVERYLLLLEKAGVEPIGLEPDVVSLMRTFQSTEAATNQPTGSTLICHFGALSTTFLVENQGKLNAIHSSAIGSLALTRALEKGLGLDASRSEEYKRSYGLANDQLEGKVRNVLLPIFDTLVREIRKTMQFYSSKNPSNPIVSRVIVSGGGANLIGLSAYLVEVLSVEVVVGNPFSSIHIDSKHKTPEDVASYAVATGLAVKDF